MIQGSLVALATPMLANGELDEYAFDRLLQLHLEAGTAAVVVGGSTGEVAGLALSELQRLVQVAVRKCEGRMPVIAGIGANSTAYAVELAAMAKDCGATAGLAVAPYYVRPNQAGLLRHFETVAQKTGFPQILYNIPSRTAVDMSNATILKLAADPLIIGIKDATSDLERATELLAAAPAHFACYAGNDTIALALMLMGGHGTISVCGNIVPRTMARLCDFALRGDAASARALNSKLLPLYRALMVDTNPIPLKAAMAHYGLCANTLRLPLLPLDAERTNAQRQLLTQAVAQLEELANLAAVAEA